MTKTILFIALLSSLAYSPVRTQFSIAIDARKDSFYMKLTGPADGYVHVPHTDFLPVSGPKPAGESDLSADVWFAWDESYFYMYAEVKDDLVLVNNVTKPQNDCLELKFDPDPSKKAWAGIVNARLSALDSVNAENLRGVDNLRGVETLPAEGHLPGEAASSANYARRRTTDGYVLEMRLAWNWIRTDGKMVTVGAGQRFGMSVSVHDNDTERRDGSIQWSAGMADEVWTTPQLLGTVEFEPDHKLKLIRANSIDPSAFMGKTYLSAARFQKHTRRVIELENFKYHVGDNAEWANLLFDDHSWEATYPMILSTRKPETGWDGIGWFRIHIAVDSSLWGVPLALSMNQSGASEVFLDGKLLYTFGKVGTSEADEERFWERDPRYVVFKDQEDHILAVRYSNFSTNFFNRYGINAGFGFVLAQDLNSWITNRTGSVRNFTIDQMLFTVVPIVLALLHLLFFLFYPKGKENLYLALFILCWGVIVFADYFGPFATNIAHLVTYGNIIGLALGPSIVFGMLTVYAGVYGRIPRQISFFVLATVVLTVWRLVQPTERWAGYLIYVLIGLAALETFRLFFFPGFAKWRTRWLTAIGFAVFMVALSYQILLSMGFVPSIKGLNVVYPYGLLALSILVSIDFSRDSARKSKNLEKQLIQVQELSLKTLEQERRAKDEEVTRKLLEADNVRKTEELEEARKLQLSMLPKELPDVPYLDIEVYMQPATEVGGDYYDFHVADNHTLTVAVGDATGHGMKAGTMVATMKGLFSAFSSSLNILPFFDTCTKTIKDMHLGNLYMGMMIATVAKDRMTVASAGMPPLLIYRRDSRSVEEVVLKGMPLGAHVGFPYTQKETTLTPGDTILLMSDGLSELFNQREEALEYPRVKELFKEAVEESPDAIIAHLTGAGETWSNGRPHNDDITFVVLKVKDVELASDQPSRLR
jgi:serine phosphatase RsbU (regulator of sigma subunit)